MKRSIEYNNQIIEFEVIYRKRKSICIKIKHDGSVEVAAPVNINEIYIMNFVKEKGEWILKKKYELEKIQNKKIIRNFQNGSTLMYLGVEVPVEVVINKKIKTPYVNLNDNKKLFVINTNNNELEDIRRVMEKWYRLKTYEIVCERIEKYSGNFSDKVTGVRIKEQKRRWASINIKNEINFNWRISMAPLEVIDYIVVHEMCHMDFRNHSKAFWERVGSIMPFYKIYHNYLKENGMNMYI